MEFTKEEVQAIYQLLSRVSIQGNEAKTVAFLQQKIETILTPKVPVKGETDKPVK